MNNIRYVLCIFANWILRRCIKSEIPYSSDIYINGRTYYLIKSTTEFTTVGNAIINIEIVSKDKRG